MLIVVRHGRSMTNDRRHKGAKYPMTDHNNVLTAKGVLGALKAGETILEKYPNGVDQIICSDLTRAKQTAFTIASAMHSTAPIHLDDQFREIMWCRDGVYRDFKCGRNLLEDDIHYRPLEDSENQFELYHRAAIGLLSHADKIINNTTVLVSHYMLIRGILALKNGDPADMVNHSPENTDPIFFNPEEIDQILENARAYISMGTSALP